MEMGTGTGTGIGAWGRGDMSKWHLATQSFGMVLEIQQGYVDKGADIAFLSQ